MDVTRHRYAVAGWGVGEVSVRGETLVGHAFPSRHRRLSPTVGGPPGGTSAPEITLARESSRPGDAFVPDLCRRFAAHLAGTVVDYRDVAVDESELSDFHRELLVAARSLAWGEVVTYGGLAALAGKPRAARAAGSFCAQSSLALVVPCHRVVAAGGHEPFALGEYGAGASGRRRKQRLLALEGTFL